MLLKQLKAEVQKDFRVLAEDLYCGYTNQALIPVYDQEKLEYVWSDFRDDVLYPKDPPAVDFDRDMLIFACRGMFPTAGYTTSIKHLVERKDGWGNTFLWVVVVNTNPKRRDLVRLDYTQPYCLVETEKVSVHAPIRGFFVRQ